MQLWMQLNSEYQLILLQIMDLKSLLVTISMFSLSYGLKNNKTTKTIVSYSIEYYIKI